MRKSRAVIGATLVVCAVACAPAPPAEQPAEPLYLFSDAEVGDLMFPEDDPTFFDQPKGLAGDGPIVEVLEPTTFERLRQPLTVHVEFRERLAAVDLDSLRVKGVGFLGIEKDVTELLQKYLTESGIKADSICLQKGRFKLRVEIADIEGRLTSETYPVQVTDEDREFCRAFFSKDGGS